MFFTFRQNNSGGSFLEPAISVIIEAGSAEEANTLAERNGLYFSGCASGRDCDCCGDRWNEQWSDEEGDEVPSSYGQPVDLNEAFVADKFGLNWGEMSDIPNFLVIYKDGSQKIVK